MAKLNVKIKYENQEHSIEMDASRTILSVAIQNQIDPPYSCEGGICGCCIARVKKGDVRMKKNSVLSDDEVSDGYVLTCQAIPISDDIEIDYDDI